MHEEGQIGTKQFDSLAILCSTFHGKRNDRTGYVSFLVAWSVIFFVGVHDKSWGQGEDTAGQENRKQGTRNKEQGMDKEQRTKNKEQKGHGRRSTTVCRLPVMRSPFVAFFFNSIIIGSWDVGTLLPARGHLRSAVHGLRFTARSEGSSLFLHRVLVTPTGTQ